ncbi:M48 family metallopeptidase [Nocardioides iriomotensis]|uniref:M48 family metallopeptidase n=1 Tax=Nocardioides iriomotensis TaxID=715784 RepID=UPI001F10823C|nr:M48 family metallopeptidase [Nocardioides iriomotensis]
MTSTPRLNRRGAVAMLVLAVVGLVLAASLLVPWEWVPGGHLVPMSAGKLFTAEQLLRGEEYARVARLLSWSSLAVSLAVVGALGFTRLGSRLVSRLTSCRRWFLAVPVATLAVLLVGRVVTLPFGLALRQRNLDYGLTRQSLAGWFSDWGRGLLVDAVVTSLLLLILVALMRRRPRDWYVAGAGVVVVLTFVGSLLYPVVIEPLFNKFTPMADGAFKSAVLRLADKEGVHVDDVLVADASRRTTTYNAYVSGFGGTRRIVVFDTLMEGLPRKEALVVVAHELAHAKNNDVLVGTILGALGGVAGVAALALVLDIRAVRERAGIDDPADARLVPLVLALVAIGSLLASPAVNSVSRALEARADRVSLQTTGADGAFIAMQHRLAVQAVRDPTPPAWSQFWFGTHPTVLQRAGLPSSLEAARS